MAVYPTVQRLWRGTHPDRTSRLAWLVFILGSGTLLATVAAGLLNRIGAIPYSTALMVLRYAVYVALGGLVLGVVALVRAATGARRRGWTLALAGFILTAGWVAVPVYYVTVLYPKNPPIHDITTDTEKPPEFIAVVALRPPGTHPVTYAGAEVADQQKKFFPNLGPLRVAKPPAEVFTAAAAALNKLGLTPVATVPEQGRIEATQRSVFFGFVDDLVVRVQPDGTGSRVDVRSASRVGRNDLGANARRVQRYLAELQELLKP